MGPSSWIIATEIEQAFDVFAVRIKCYSCCAGQFDPLMDGPLTVVMLHARLGDDPNIWAHRRPWLANDDRQEVVAASSQHRGSLERAMIMRLWSGHRGIGAGNVCLVERCLLEPE